MCIVDNCDFKITIQILFVKVILGMKMLKRIPNQEKSSPLKESSSVSCGIATAENPELDPMDIDMQ